MVLSHKCHHLFHTLIGDGITLNFPKFNTKAPKLNLEVKTSHIFHFSVLVITSKVSCVIHGHTRNIGAIRKHCSVKIVPVPVAVSDISAGVAYLSRYALWKKISVLIQYKGVAVL